MTLKEFIVATKINLHRISQGSGVAYSTLLKHVNKGHRLSVKTAEKVAAFDPRLSVVDLLGLKETPPKRSRKAA